MTTPIHPIQLKLTPMNNTAIKVADIGSAACNSEIVTGGNSGILCNSIKYASAVEGMTMNSKIQKLVQLAGGAPIQNGWKKFISTPPMKKDQATIGRVPN